MLEALGTILLVSWNKRIERVADARYQIETTSLYRICVLAGIDRPERCKESEANHSDVGSYIGKHINSHSERGDPTHPGRREQIENHTEWAHIRALDPQLEADLWTMAQRYGYGREPPPKGIIQHDQESTSSSS